MASKATHSQMVKARRTMVWVCHVGAVTLLLAVGGCGRKADLPVPASAGLKPVNPNDPPEAQQTARLAVLMAMRRGIPPPPPALKLKGGEPATPEILGAYNFELLRARIQERRSPESLEELVQKWIQQRRLLPALPVPPPRKRIVYDDLNGIIRLDPP